MNADLKQSDDGGKRPQFGNRYLTEEKDVYTHNAWDDVEWDEEQEKAARDIVASNCANKLPPENIENLQTNASQNWDKFYGIHNNRFFKDRNWLFTEFPELFPSHHLSIHPNKDETNIRKEKVIADHPLTILEVGCGVGNTIFPLLEVNTNPQTRVFACDFSSTAVDLVKQHPDYNKYQSEDGVGRCNAFVCDITKPEDWESNAPFQNESLDAITLLFVMSAIDPINGSMESAVKSMYKYLKPGGMLFFRDYGRYDLAQLRLKPGKCLSDNFYARGDGTFCYFFTEQDILNLFVEKGGFQLISPGTDVNGKAKEPSIKVDRRLQVNRGKKLKMYRVWMQAKFKKPL